MSMTHKGFSLVELMVVLAIIGIIGVISVPNVVTGIPKYRVKAAASDMAANLRKARSLAIKEHRDVTIFFDPDNKRYSIDGRFFPEGKDMTEYYGSGVRYGQGEATGSIGGGAIPSDYVTFNDNTVTFDSLGISSGQGYVYITNDKGNSYAVGVRNVAGSIAVRRWTGAQWYP
jgi:prepilin-type N-terminal cleavage/methylation domain-containing protein